MLSSGLRKLLLWLALIAALALIAVLFGLGWLDPAGEIGPVGIVASFLCSLVGLIALVGLARPHEPVSVIDRAAAGPVWGTGGYPQVRLSFGVISLFAAVFSWGLSVALVLGFFFLPAFWSNLGVNVWLRLISICLGLIILFGCLAITAVVVALLRREPRLIIPCVGALTCVPVAVYAGYLLLLLIRGWSPG